MSSRVVQTQPIATAMSTTGKPSSHDHSSSHVSCHSTRMRRFVLPTLLSFLSLSFLLFLALAEPEMSFAEFGFGHGDLLKRQGVSAGGSAGGGGGQFISNKLYIIVIVVGLILCVVAAVMCSAWACRGAFHNPLCCPCYCCALCGGLVCIECISCGLCADLAQQV